LPTPEVVASELKSVISQMMYEAEVSSQYLHKYPNDAEVLVYTGEADIVITHQVIHIAKEVDITSLCVWYLSL